MHNRKLFVITSLLVMLFLAACSAVPASAGQEPAPQANQPSETPRRTITVAGQGRVTVAPDIAYVNIGVRTEADEVTAALNANTDQASQVAAALGGLGVDPKDIQTTSFNVYPVQNYGPDGMMTGTRYVVENTVYVTVRDLTRMGEMLDTIVRSGANNINGISFDTTQKEQAVTEARKVAIQDARRQAEELTAAAGVQLGDLLTLSAYASGGPSPYYDARTGAGMSPSASTVPVSAGQLVISVDVNMTYEMQ